jgi:DNA-binding protein H-NS
MAKTYEQMQRHIEALQAEAEVQRLKELDEVIARIRHAVEFYGITASDLGLGRKTAGKSAATKNPGRKAAAKVAKGPLKGPLKAALKGAAKSSLNGTLYRDETGRTWVGRGKRPQWLREQLAAGRSLEDFKVKAS